MIYRADQNCRMCKHYLDNRKCLAFPEGIPAALWSGENPHYDPYPGDQGFRHELKIKEFPALSIEQVQAFTEGMIKE